MTANTTGIKFEDLDTDTKLNVLAQGLVDLSQILERIEENIAELNEKVQNINLGEPFEVGDFN